MDIHSKKTELVVVATMVSYILATVVLGIEVPGSIVPRAVVGFCLLSVLPGYLLVSLLGFGDRPLGRLAIYSVGLSLVVVVCLTIALDVLSVSVFAIDRPLSPQSLTLTVSVFVLGLSVVRFARGSSFSSQQQMARTQGWRFGRPPWRFEHPIHRSSWQQLSTRDRTAFAVMSLFPICAALITVLTDTAGFNGLLIALLCALSVVPLVLVRWRGSPALYPYAVWAVAAAVLLQMTLVSGHLWGWDIHYEYATALRIAENGHWNPTVADSSRSLVTVTLLAAVYSMVTGVELVWVYKLFYPLFVSLLPVGVWYIVRSEFEDRSIATLAPFVLMFFYGFFKNMPDKQLVAGLFAVLLLVAFLDAGLSTLRRWVLGLAFAVGLVFSHYGVSLLFVGFLAFALVARYAVRIALGVEVTARITRIPLVAFLSAFWVGWYLFTASGVNFYRVVGTGSRMLAVLPFPTTNRNGVAYATTGFESGYWVVYKFMYILLLGLIALGVLSVLYRSYMERHTAKSAEYTLFSVGVCCFLASTVIVTFSMGFDRALEIALFVLSPFAIVGVKATASLISWLTARRPKSGLRTLIDAISLLSVGSMYTSIPESGDSGRVIGNRDSENRQYIYTLFAVFLALLFLFSSGTVFALAGQPLPPYNLNLDENAGWPVYSQNEVEATRWLESHIDDNATVAVYNTKQSLDSRDSLLLREVFDTRRLEPIWLDRASLDESAYVYVSRKPVLNPDSDEYVYIDVRETPFYEQTLADATLVYTNPNATIYYVPGDGEDTPPDRTEG